MDVSTVAVDSTMIGGGTRMKDYHVVPKGETPSVRSEPLHVYRSQFDYSAIEAFHDDYSGSKTPVELYKILGFNGCGDYRFKRLDWN